MHVLIINCSDISAATLQDRFSKEAIAADIAESVDAAVQQCINQAYEMICIVSDDSVDAMGAIQALHKDAWMPLLVIQDKDIDSQLKTQLDRVKNFFDLKAQQASKEHAEFIADMSHELRNPLNTVVGFTDLLLSDTQEVLSDGQQTQLIYIKKAAKHLQNIITDTVNNSRLQAGTISYQFVPTNLAQLIDSVYEQFAEQAAKHDIRIDLSHVSSLHEVMADQQRLHQVIANLLSNAIHYNFPGGSVSLKTEETADSKIRLSVIDTGKGIAAEDYEKLFIPYARLGNKHETEGTGLGLVTSKYIINAMQGEIGFESELGAGATFWIELPIMRERAD